MFVLFLDTQLNLCICGICFLDSSAKTNPVITPLQPTIPHHAIKVKYVLLKEWIRYTHFTMIEKGQSSVLYLFCLDIMAYRYIQIVRHRILISEIQSNLCNLPQCTIV